MNNVTMYHCYCGDTVVTESTLVQRNIVALLLRSRLDQCNNITLLLWSRLVQCIIDIVEYVVLYNTM